MNDITESTELALEVSNSTAQGLLGRNVEQMDLGKLARYNGILQALKKAVSDKRKETKPILQEKIESGDLDGYDLQDISDKSIGPVVPGVNVYITESRRERFKNSKAIEILKDNENIDFEEAVENDVVERQYKVDDMQEFLDYLDEQGVDYDDYVEVKGHKVNEDKMKALKEVGPLTKTELQECYTVSESTKLSCTLKSEFKDAVIQKVSEGSAEQPSTKELTSEELQEIEGVGPKVANRILNKVR